MFVCVCSLKSLFIERSRIDDYYFDASHDSAVILTRACVKAPIRAAAAEELESKHDDPLAVRNASGPVPVARARRGGRHGRGVEGSRLNRVVAIKRLKGQHIERFAKEARGIATLNHPHICQVHDVGPDYLVLEFVEGRQLPRPVALDEAVRGD